MSKKKPTYLKANHFEVAFIDDDLTEVERAALSEAVLKAFPSYTAQTLDIEFLVPDDPRIAEIIAGMCQGDIPDIILRPLIAKAGTDRGTPGPFEIMFSAGKCVNDRLNFDYEDSDEVTHVLMFQFFHMAIATRGKSVEIAVIKPKTEGNSS